ncbi:uncharacterized protein H6S33_003707 [Morchella sextelata]|uniref:uncharacterized protein n=1 Tax=Morchella sextelata TaxID=1174677 RepID=UPI001D0535CE|nr:uncharacterized protein H6S33_003707 [Morchella sextelata]KAH0606873.1 hypothetical protein H6S33_003707 [Morchella sextelata]
MSHTRSQCVGAAEAASSWILGFRLPELINLAQSHSLVERKEGACPADVFIYHSERFYGGWGTSFDVRIYSHVQRGVGAMAHDRQQCTGRAISKADGLWLEILVIWVVGGL